MLKLSTALCGLLKIINLRWQLSCAVIVSSCLFLSLQSQQDLSLDELDDACGTSGGEVRRSRFTKRLRSPDRSVWDISLFSPGGEKKNEIEKMFEKFKIRLAAVADGEDAVSDDRPHGTTSTAATGISDSDFSPAHSEYSKLIGGVNKAYTPSPDDDETVAVPSKPDEDKAGKKKHKHKKDKEKKSRHGKSKSRHADGAGLIPAGATSLGQFSVPSSADVALPAAGESSFSQSAASNVAPSTEDFGFPSVHTSCVVADAFSSTPVEAHVEEEFSSVDWNHLDFSTSELLPTTPTKEVRFTSCDF